MLIKGAPLGVRTLDPTDYKYCGDYTQEEGSNYNIAGGFNYHNGPEWVWPLGYFLRAKLHFHGSSSTSLVAAMVEQQQDGETVEEEKEEEETVGRMVHKFLQQHRTYIQTNHYRGLPELTNANGSYCPPSCEVQAWSSATLLDALYHLHQFE